MPAFVLTFSEAFCIFFSKKLNSLPGVQKSFQPSDILLLNLGLKPQERVTNKKLDLRQAPILLELRLFNKPLTHGS